MSQVTRYMRQDLCRNGQDVCLDEDVEKLETNYATLQAQLTTLREVLEEQDRLLQTQVIDNLMKRHHSLTTDGCENLAWRIQNILDKAKHALKQVEP